MERQTAIPSLISVSELDETLISTFNLTIQILDTVTSIINIEGLKTEAKQRKRLSLKALVFSALVFQNISNFLSPDVLFPCCAEDVPLKF